MKSVYKKLFTIIAILIMNGLGFMNSVYASNYIDSAYVYSKGDCRTIIKI